MAQGRNPGGAGLRWWSFWALGQYFAFTVDVSADRQVVTAGPYRLLRHPGYAGGLRTGAPARLFASSERNRQVPAAR
jgi:protein-S-isoprenylcysteine O-methyltransferase Ste14